MGRPFRILSIDGGGIRGIIPALVLAEIERRTESRVAALFDLVAGTSTGGVIALAVTKPDDNGRPQYKAAEIAELYSTKGGTIFSTTILHQLSSAWGLLGAKYPSAGLEKVLDQYFGETRLKHALTDVLVPAFAIDLRSPWFFRSRRARTEPERDFAMKKVARATSAAPTYLEPLKLDGVGKHLGTSWGLVDGGVYANNPAMCALVEAQAVYGAEDVLVVSLGTGEPTRGIPWKEAKDWGLAAWARPLLDVVFEGVSDTVHFQVEQLCPPVDGQLRYYRFQVPLPELRSQFDEIDDARSATISKLQAVAEQLIRESDTKLEKLCAALVATSSTNGDANT